MSANVMVLNRCSGYYYYYFFYIFLVPSVVNIPRVKNIKLKSNLEWLTFGVIPIDEGASESNPITLLLMFFVFLLFFLRPQARGLQAKN